MWKNYVALPLLFTGILATGEIITILTIDKKHK